MLAVVDHWFHSATDHSLSDCEAFGISVHQDKEFIKEKILCVLHSNMKALRVFCACMTQWHYTPIYNEKKAIPVGMDYAGVRACADFLGMCLKPEDFKRITILERYVLEQHHDIKNL